MKKIKINLNNFKLLVKKINKKYNNQKRKIKKKINKFKI